MQETNKKKSSETKAERRLIVQKYGGATLSDAEKIKSVAARISEQSISGDHIIAVVSAMGKTTNQLINLAHQVSEHPHRREMDMLLTVGERISMSLVSMALNDNNTPAISFTGSQAGIFTDDSHVNAFIIDVKAHRLQEAISDNKVVVLAGFQGVSPKTKEITTLGRGGSDTTAVAMAAYFNAERCEILKDVPAIFTADPNLVNQAKPISELNYDQLLEMTFWGAKVLHYRSVELAKIRNVVLYIGPASKKTSDGTLVKKDLNMFESCRALSLNTHETVIEISSKSLKPSFELKRLHKLFEVKQIPFPQLLDTQVDSQGVKFLLTGPSEIIESIRIELSKNNDNFTLNSTDLSTLTLTCTGITSPEISEKVLDKMEEVSIPFKRIFSSSMSITIVLDKSYKVQAMKSLHSLIEI